MKLKRCLSLVLSFTLLIPILCVSTFAEDQTDRAISAIQDVIENISSEKEYYGFENVDLSSLWVGDIIPTYLVENNTLIPSTGMDYYPILDDAGTLISLAIVTSGSDKNFANISLELVSLINQQIENNSNERIALIFDREGAYYWNGTNLFLLTSYESNYKIMERSYVTNVPSEIFKSISTSKILKNRHMNLSERIHPLGFEDDSAYTDAPVKRQPSGSDWCWAGCMASIVRKVKGADYDYTCEEMAKLYTTDRKERATSQDIQRRLRDSFNMMVWIYETNDLTKLFENLCRDRASCARFKRSVGSHFVVIRGIDFGADTFSFMDPARRDSTYHVGHIANRSGDCGTLEFSSCTTCEKYTMVEYLYQQR